MYDDNKLEEVLAELKMQLEGPSSYQEQKNYKVAEWRSLYERLIVEAGMKMKEKNEVKPKEVKLGRRFRSLARCRGPASSNLCPRGVLYGSKCHHSSSNSLIICNSRQLRICVLRSNSKFLYRMHEQDLTVQHISKHR